MSIPRYTLCAVLVLIGSIVGEGGVGLSLMGILLALDDIADAIRGRDESL